jgi:subtilisin family serine protease
VLRAVLLEGEALRRAREFLGPEDDLAANYWVFIPPQPEDGEIQEGAVGFGGALADWLGATGDRSQWGRGVTVAIIDSGVDLKHPNLPAGIREFDLVGGGERSGHGTAVASLVSGGSDYAPGLAPSASLLSYRIADADGLSSSFLLAEAIVAAADAGARLINISMGSTGDSALVRDAVAYAQGRGSLIIAASGNSGGNWLDYPAAYDGVLSVGSVDARGERLLFSNSSNALATVAPGLDLNAAWQDEQMIRFTGTSASSAVVAGALAAIMTMDAGRTLSNREALTLYQTYLNDAGAPGPDAFYGGGIVDLGRIQERRTAGIHDAALAGQVLLEGATPGTPPVWVVTVQNRGTEMLVNTAVTVETPSGPRERNIPVLRPGEISSFTLPAGNMWFRGDLLPEIRASVSLDPAVRDLRPANNSRLDLLPSTPQAP